MSWKEEDNQLYKSFKFQSFEQAMQWMQDAAGFISKTDHHPKWTNVYNGVEVWLSTHDAGNIVTEKDRKLAAHLDELYSLATQDKN